jgi:hypothetical protein
LNDQWVIKELRAERKQFLESNENENSLPEPLGHSKAMLRRKFIVMSAYIKKNQRECI